MIFKSAEELHREQVNDVKSKMPEQLSEIMELSYRINATTNFIVFTELLGHVNRLNVRIGSGSYDNIIYNKEFKLSPYEFEVSFIFYTTLSYELESLINILKDKLRKGIAA